MMAVTMLFHSDGLGRPLSLKNIWPETSRSLENEQQGYAGEGRSRQRRKQLQEPCGRCVLGV